MNNLAVEAVDDLLPQTQCRQCGFPGCRPYAEAIVAGAVPINRCPPGGDEVIAELAAVLGVPTLPLDEDCGGVEAPAVAVIDEAACIGCTLCIAACPVDAIAGARRLMHTVIAAECTGCRLRQRHLARKQRLVRQSRTRRAAVASAATPAATRKRAVLERALSRARARVAAKR